CLARLGPTETSRSEWKSRRAPRSYERPLMTHCGHRDPPTGSCFPAPIGCRLVPPAALVVSAEATAQTIGDANTRTITNGTPHFAASIASIGLVARFHEFITLPSTDRSRLCPRV